MRIRRFRSIALTLTCAETPCISHSHVTCLPGSSRPLPRVNQNRDVMAGSTNASNTSATGFRMSISAFAVIIAGFYLIDPGHLLGDRSTPSSRSTGPGSALIQAS